MKLTEILHGQVELGPYVLYYPKMAQAFGSVNNALLVSKLVFWSGPGGIEKSDGWIYSDLGTIEAETGLSTWALRQSREELTKTGVVQSEYLRLTHELRFKLDKDKLNTVWHEHLMKPQMAREMIKSPSDLMKPQMDHLMKPQVALEKTSDAARARDNRFKEEENEKKDEENPSDIVSDLFGQHSEKKKKKSTKSAPVSDNPPTLSEFMAHAFSKHADPKSAETQYEIWDSSEWMDGNGNQIFGWKGKLTLFISKRWGAFAPSTTRSTVCDNNDEYRIKRV